MNISPLIAIVPVVLAVALIIIVVRRNITERRPGEPIDIAGAIPAFVVLMVAVVFIGGMASSVAPYSWDEEDGELTINQDVGSGSQKWDSLGADVKSLVINGNVKSVADGAFDTLTGLEHISISDSVESITSAAFGVTLVNWMGQSAENPAAGDYYGSGGTLYLCDPEIYTYSSDRTTITGLASSASEATHLMIPSSRNGVTITTIGYEAFYGKGSIEFVGFVPDSALTTFAYRAFGNCTSLASISFPATVTDFKTNSFNKCPIPELVFPDSVTTIGGTAFANNTALTTVIFGSGIQTITANAFSGDTSVTSATFSGGFAATGLESSWAPWTFKDVDGTTTLSKTVASNLAGSTFQGTSAALVKVLPGQLALTPDQIQQVQLHTQELQDQELDIQPLPFQPSLQTQEQEPASA